MIVADLAFRTLRSDLKSKTIVTLRWAKRLVNAFERFFASLRMTTPLTCDFSDAEVGFEIKPSMRLRQLTLGSFALARW